MSKSKITPQERGWPNDFNRRISLILVDYTKMALGAGETKAALLSAWVDSAILARQAQAQLRMGGALTQLSIKGKTQEEFLTILGRFLAHAFSLQKNSPIRYMDISVKDHFNESGELENSELVIVIKIEMEHAQEAKEAVIKFKNNMERLLKMFGMRHFLLSDPFWVKSDSDTLGQPLKNEKIWNQWLKFALEKSSTIKEQSKY